MENYIGYAVSGLLIFSAVLLGVLIPGGAVESRGFSHISPFILGMFNTFLTILGIGSMILAYFSFSATKVVFVIAAICGLSYFFVYALDLSKTFPVSPDKMPPLLFIIEIIGLILAITLTLFSLLAIYMPSNVTKSFEISFETTVIALALIVALGSGIVLFATKSAMKKLP